MSEDLIRRSDAIEALGEEPYVWTDDDEFAIGERSQWIDDVSAIKAVPSVDTSEAKEYILSELSDLLEEYSELDENGLHDPKWCGVREAYGIVKNAPFADRPSAVDLSSVYSTAYKSGYEKGKADRPKGEWKHLKGDEWLCSECGHVIRTEGSWEHPLERGKDYCEHCGARMKGADDDTPVRKDA